MDIQELIDSIYNKSISIKGEPLGKVTQFYPGASSPIGTPDYKTYTTINQYVDKLQQPIESNDLLKEAEELEDNNIESEEEEFDTGEIGRIYELKKIFSRLISLESFLSEAGDEILIKLSSYTSEAINLFKLVIDNIDQFIDEIDNIIILFYEFLQISYNLVSKIYNKKYDDDKEGDK